MTPSLPPHDENFCSRRPFFTLLQKELFRFLHVYSQTLITPVIIASLYLFVFGATLGERISVVDGFSYAQFVIPGLILMGVINNSFSNTSASLFMSRHLGSIADLLVMPLTSGQIVAAYTLAAMVRGLIVGTSVGLISLCFARLPWALPLAAIAMAVLSSFLFATLGMIAGIFANSFDGLSMYINFVLLPLIFLGGVFYPISILPPFWQKLSLCNPLFYLLDGFRHALLGVGEMPLWISFSFAGLFALLILSAAILLIDRSSRFRA
ncbi:MAG: ABC transporter permease [Desulfuromonadaceae bacterium]|nr:ABC transporter permease [Desulfuromonadaceae bacterium]